MIVHNEFDKEQTSIFEKSKNRRKKHSNASSQYLGVTLDKRYNRYRAKFKTTDANGNPHNRHLGSFPPTPEGERQAAIAYDKIAIVFGLETNILKPLARS